jgi:hypothetical protein
VRRLIGLGNARRHVPAVVDVLGASPSGLAPVAAPDLIQLPTNEGATMLQFLTSWPVLMAVAMAILALAFLIEPAIPARPDGSFTEVAGLTF